MSKDRSFSKIDLGDGWHVERCDALNFALYDGRRLHGFYGGLGAAIIAAADHVRTADVKELLAAWRSLEAAIKELNLVAQAKVDQP